MMPSEVVGLILHFRTPRRTVACIRSLVAEGIRRIVLVDNSDDLGVSIAGMQEDLNELGVEGVTVDVLAQTENLGFSKGVNLGLAYIATEECGAVLLINSDARLERGALTVLLEHIDAATLCVPSIRSAEGNVASPSARFYQPATALLARAARSGFMSYASGCCLLIGSTLAGSPLFDEDYFFYGEDVQLARDLGRRGSRIVYCPTAIVAHDASSSAMNGSLFYEYNIAKGHWLLARKLATTRWQRDWYVACRCITLPLRATIRCLRLRSFAPWAALWAATIDTFSGHHRSYTPTRD